MPLVTHALQQSSISIPRNTWMSTAANSENLVFSSASPHHMKWKQVIPCMPPCSCSLCIAGWDTHPILGQNLRCILWTISVEMGTLNVYKSFGNMSGFEGPWGQFTSCINISCLEVRVCLSVSTSHASTTVHAFCPSSPCSLFAKVTFSTLVWGLGGLRDGEHSGHPLPSMPYTHLDDWYGLQPPIPLQFTTLSAGCDVGGSELNAENMSSSVYPSPSVLLHCPKY